MPGRLDPAVADVRRAVRASLRDLDPGEVVLVACSGGPDSMALAAAAAFESRSAGLTAGAVVVDHALQSRSDEVCAVVAARLEALGLAPVEVVRVEVDAHAPQGPEAAARAARYATLDRAADAVTARCVLLGHTRDDQAETVLLGLARGSGARSLAGMRPVAGRYRRPLLDLPRATTQRACAAEGVETWQDPHNADPGFARVRVRHHVLPVLEAELGPGVGDALARTGRLLRDDADALDAFAATAYEDCAVGVVGDRDDPGDSGDRDDSGDREDRGDPGDRGAHGLDVRRLHALLPAVRRRVLRRAALDAGCPGTDLGAGHVDAVEALVTDWHGQRGVDLPGPVRAQRSQGTLRFVRQPVGG